MNLMLLVSILIRLVAMGWSIVLWKQIKDWRIGFLTIMLGLMALRQILTLWHSHESWTLSITWQTTEFPGLIVSVMALLAIFFLKQMLTEHKQTKEDSSNAENLLQNVINTSQDFIFVKDTQLRTILCNTVFAQSVGKEPEELYGRTDIENGWPAEHVLGNQEKGIRGYEFDDRAALEGNLTHINPDPVSINGEVRYFDTLKTPLRNSGGKIIGVLGIARDITEHQQTQERIMRFGRIFEDSLNEIFLFNADSLKFVQVNEIAQQNLGYTMEEFQEMTPIDLRLEYTTALFEELVAPLRNGEKKKIVFETVHQRKDNSIYDVEVHLQLMKNNQDAVFSAIIMDITDRKEAQEELTFQASHDALTKLANRYEFERRAGRLLSTVHQDEDEHALCYLDLDQFKVVNDTCGHIAGDELLRQISAVLKDTVRKRDTLARLGGDEFGVLMEHCSLDHAHRVSTSFLKAIQGYQFLWEGHTFKIGVSIGLVSITESTTNITELLMKADAACYMAKEKGRNRIHIYQSDDSDTVQRHGEMQWVARLHRAIDEDRFCLYAQTIMPLEDSHERHYELLVRMLDEQGKLIPPGAFLPAAERYDLISKIDRWVVNESFSQLMSNPEFCKQVKFISINISGQSLTEMDFLDFIIIKLNETGIDGSKICFEITETAAISNLTMAIKFISTLKVLGCQFALDDFGSGLSSFGYLKNLPVDYLKIDGMFVKDIVNDKIDHAMVKSINEIGQVMGMETIAEFVENDEIKGMLREIGVNYAQGYGIDKPQSFDELLDRSSNVTDIKDAKDNGIES